MVFVCKRMEGRKHRGTLPALSIVYGSLVNGAKCCELLELNNNWFESNANHSVSPSL